MGFLFSQTVKTVLLENVLIFPHDKSWGCSQITHSASTIDHGAVLK